MVRLFFHALLVGVAGLRALAEPPPTIVEVTIEPPKFGDVASILKVDSTVATFKFDAPVSHLALVLEAYPKEPLRTPVARLALDLTKPVKEGRFCVQMADQGFIPLGNGAPHQMQLFMQLDCGGTLISSSQSFLKEKFNFGRSLARLGAGAHTYHVTGSRAPVFWLMGNSDTGTYFNDDNLDKLIAKNKDAYVLIASLDISKDGQAPVLATAAASSPVETTKQREVPKSSAPVIADPAAAALAFVGPPYPVPGTDSKQGSAAKVGTTSSSKENIAPKSASSSKSSASSKKKKRSS